MAYGDKLEEICGRGHALYAKGRAAMDGGDLDSAVALLHESAEIDPHFKTFELWGECLLKQNLADKAIIPLSAAVGIGINSRPFRALYLLAQALEKIGRIDWAIEKLELALEMKPDYKAARELRDQMILQAGSKDDTLPPADR